MSVVSLNFKSASELRLLLKYILGHHSAVEVGLEPKDFDMTPNYPVSLLEVVHKEVQIDCINYTKTSISM